MRLLIKKFALKRSGALYGPGSVLELSDDDGRRLMERAPKNYEILPEPEAEKPAQKRRTKKTPASMTETDAALPEVNVEGLVK